MERVISFVMFARGVAAIFLVVAPAGCSTSGDVSRDDGDARRTAIVHRRPAVFAAEVVDVALLAEYEGTVRFMDPTAAFVVTLRLLDDSGLELSEDAVLGIAVHSVVLTFGAPAERIIGTRFTVSLMPGTADSGGDLGVVPYEADDPPGR